jgi:protein-L-isoaspartate(D-aspartate) O-methyltransferase
VGEEGKVIGIEHIEELNEQARKNVRRDHPEFLDRQLVFVTGDGRLGYPEEAPYDCM